MKTPLILLNQPFFIPWLESCWQRLSLMLLLLTPLASIAPAQTMQWNKTIGGNSFDELHSLQQTSDGGYILGGYSLSPISTDKTDASKGVYDYWVVKLNAAGNKEWDKTFGGSESDLLFSLQQTSDGGYVLGGWSGSGISGDKTEALRGGVDYWVVKIDANGKKQWDKTIGEENLMILDL